MSSGQKAADQTRDAAKEIGDAGESLRKNINSFADNLIGGNKTHGGTGVHPDAKKTGDELAKGAGDAAGKVEGAFDKSKRQF